MLYNDAYNSLCARTHVGLDSRVLLDTDTSSGSNENGSWVRYPDGTQICWFSTIQQRDLTAFNYPNAHAVASLLFVWNFPMPFIVAPCVQVSGDVDWGPGLESHLVTNVYADHSQQEITIGSAVGVTTGVFSSLLAVGRWK
jgi:hypothetical protein